LRIGWWLAAILLVYLVFAVSLDRTYLPWCDEAWFASPGLNLAEHGNFGTSVLDETASWNQRNLIGLHTHTYWFAPLHPLAVAGWSLVMGGSLFAVRLLSATWGVIALLAWYLTARKLAGNARAALFGAALLAIDFQFLWCAGVARMDMMTEALVASSFAAFLWLREEHLGKAILVSQALIACAGLTHPIALGAFAGLLALTLYYDWRRVRAKHLALAIVPYLIAGLGWGLYIREDPAMFWAQFHGNVTGRLSRPGGFLQSLWSQFSERYLWVYGMAPETQGFSHIKVVLLAVYGGAIAVAALMPDFRKRREHRALFVLIAAQTFVYSNLDKDVHMFYLVHIMAPVIVLTGLVLDWVLQTKRAPVWAIASVAVVILVVQVSVTAVRIRADGYDLLYLDTTNYLKQHTSPGDLIMGSSELAFQLGFDSNLVDDFRLGYITGKRPDVIVLDKNRYQEWIPNLKVFQPDAWRYTTELIARDFREVHRNAAYITYARVSRK
jgi:4-amino-4-deoxy-L-arabinose transferase-like glycosyltransferase